MSENRDRGFFSDTRFVTNRGPTVHPLCGRLMACALPTSHAQRTRQQRSQSANALKNRRYSKSTFSSVACSPMMDWMFSSPNRVTRASLLLPHVLSSDQAYMYESDSPRKPTSEHPDIMLTMPAQYRSRQVL